MVWINGCVVFFCDRGPVSGGQKNCWPDKPKLGNDLPLPLLTHVGVIDWALHSGGTLYYKTILVWIKGFFSARIQKTCWLDKRK